ncbi:LysR substrate-binding domain-containing protein [Phytopseudomonas flavescens]|uniref:LysR substrate-binding domain-containing protein n=1 Tax=Phytopseudomonas flavescens TaxID=29435 RepID=UPI001FC95E98|nr:LysR substrate-binding domain-containing protein [Pseudomonas flavescens]
MQIDDLDQPKRCVAAAATPEDLKHHSLLGLNHARAASGWPLCGGDQEQIIVPVGHAQASDGEGVRRLALAGLGLARLAMFQAREDIAAGRLVVVLQACNPGDREEVHAVSWARAATCHCASGRSSSSWCGTCGTCGSEPLAGAVSGNGAAGMRPAPGWERSRQNFHIPWRTLAPHCGHLRCGRRADTRFRG